MELLIFATFNVPDGPIPAVQEDLTVLQPFQGNALYLKIGK